MFNNSQSQENQVTPDAKRAAISCWNRAYNIAEATQKALLTERPDLYAEPATVQVAPETIQPTIMPSGVSAEVIDMAAHAEQQTISEQQRFIDDSRQKALEAYESAA